MIGKLAFFTKAGPVYSSKVANELFKKKWGEADLPIYLDIPLNDSVLRDTNKLFEMVIEGGERVINLLQSANVNFNIFANFDNYLTVKPKIKHKSSEESNKEYEKLKKLKPFTEKNERELENRVKRWEIWKEYEDFEKEYVEHIENKLIVVRNKDNLSEYEEDMLRTIPDLRIISIDAMIQIHPDGVHTTEELNRLMNA